MRKLKKLKIIFDDHGVRMDRCTSLEATLSDYITELQKAVREYKYLLKNYTDVPKFVIDHPSMGKSLPISKKDREWAELAIKEYKESKSKGVEFSTPKE